MREKKKNNYRISSHDFFRSINETETRVRSQLQWMWIISNQQILGQGYRVIYTNATYTRDIPVHKVSEMWEKWGENVHTFKLNVKFVDILCTIKAPIWHFRAQKLLVLMVVSASNFVAFISCGKCNLDIKASFYHHWLLRYPLECAVAHSSGHLNM